MKGIIITLVVTAVVITGGLSYYLGPDDIAGCRTPVAVFGDRCEKVDAIVAISGGDTAARAEEAIRLYKDGWSDRLIFSGAALDRSGPSNARAMQKRALEAGVPNTSIMIEEDSESTEENAIKTVELTKSLHLERVLLVTSAYHQRRASLHFERAFGATAVIVNHPVANDNQWSSWWWMTPYGWWLGIGEVAKIVLMGATSE